MTVVSEDDFLIRVAQSSSRLMWFLGAGASRSSGLPTASDLIWDLKLKLYCARQNQNIRSHDLSNSAVRIRVQSYMDALGYPPAGSSAEYSFYFEQAFGSDLAAQQRYLRRQLDLVKGGSTIGHRVLAAQLHLGQVKAIFTTNFDEVVETAFSEMTGKPLVPFHLEGSYAALDALNAEDFPLYVKLHGDFRYQSLKNLSDDLKSNDERLQTCFIAASSRFGLVVAGYSGRDENVMNLLRKAVNQTNAFPHGMFWTTPRIDDVAPSVLEFVDYARARGVAAAVVATGTFDELLSKIWRQTRDKPDHVDERVRWPVPRSTRVAMPSRGRTYPLLRLNALRVIGLPRTCGAVSLPVGDSVTDVRRRLFESGSDCTIASTDRLMFWGNSAAVLAVTNRDNAAQVESLDISYATQEVATSTVMKAFLEEGIAKACVHGRPLRLNRADRTWHVTVNPASSGAPELAVLREAVNRGGGGALCGRVSGSTTWAESVSVKLEERDGSLWVLLRPDIWISPLAERRNATDFLKRKQLKRYNTQAFEILSAWIAVLLGGVGGGTSALVTAHSGSDFEASFELSTRTAYSRRA